MALKRAEINGEVVMHVDGEAGLMTLADIIRKKAEEDIAHWERRMVDVFDTKERTTDGNYKKISRMSISDALLKFN